jgi:hypothetical protein
MGQKETEEHKVVGRFRIPLEDVGRDVAHVWLSDLHLVARQHLGGGVNGRNRPSMPREFTSELPGPQASSRTSPVGLFDGAFAA